MKTKYANETLRQASRERFATASKLEGEYLRALHRLTKQVDRIVRSMAPGGEVRDSVELQNALRRYAEQVRPWARKVAERMVARVAKTDEQAWITLGRQMGKALRTELQSAPTGEFLRLFMDEQVHLITSLPLDAAQRVHDLTREAMVKAKRAEEVKAQILETGSVTETRARLIARTEIARTASGLTMARAQHVGSTHYIWRTSGDLDVRESHKKMEGAIVPWATPPLLSDGTRTHAGMIYNCRCYPEPILPDDE